MSIRWPQTPRTLDPTRPIDRILTGGKVLVPGADASPRFAQAVAIQDGTIAAVGTDEEVRAMAGPDTQVIDVGGRTVIPGLIDSHLHVLRGGLTWTDEVTWYETPTLEEALDKLRAEVARRPEGSWIRSIGGWHPGQFAEGRGPTREELTELAPAHPVYVQLLYEDAILNDAALAAAGIDRDLPDPPNGSFERDPQTGEPTGRVRGMGAFLHVLGHVPPLPFEEQVASTAAMLRDLNAYGLTGGIDAGGFGMPPEAYEPIFQLWRDGEMTCKVRMYVCPATHGHESEEIRQWVRHTRPGFGDTWLQHVGVGEITLFGCHDLEGLTDFHVEPETQDELEVMLLDIARRGQPLHMHSVLNDTTSAILDVWERVAAEVPIRDLRWSLGHVEPISDRNLDRVAALGAGIAVQNRMVYRATDSAARWGEDAVRNGPPVRSMLDRGIPLGAGTDSTRVASPNPWVSLWWLVTGGTFDEGPERAPEQRLTRLEALEAYTRGSAWFSVEDHDRGTIEVGKAADLAVLDDDYFEVPDDAISGLGADLTLVEGRIVHAAGDLANLADR